MLLWESMSSRIGGKHGKTSKIQKCHASYFSKISVIEEKNKSKREKDENTMLFSGVMIEKRKIQASQIGENCNVTCFLVFGKEKSGEKSMMDAGKYYFAMHLRSIGYRM